MGLRFPRLWGILRIGFEEKGLAGYCEVGWGIGFSSLRGCIRVDEDLDSLMCGLEWVVVEWADGVQLRWIG